MFCPSCKSGVWHNKEISFMCCSLLIKVAKRFFTQRSSGILEERKMKKTFQNMGLLLDRTKQTVSWRVGREWEGMILIGNGLGHVPAVSTLAFSTRVICSTRWVIEPLSNQSDSQFADDVETDHQSAPKEAHHQPAWMAFLLKEWGTANVCGATRANTNGSLVEDIKSDFELRCHLEEL